MAVQDLAVDTTSRGDALSFYNVVYNASENYASDMQWTGNVTTGTSGNTSAAFKDDVQRRVNFYRAMAGLPADIGFDSEYSGMDQLAALMMSANDSLSHSPPDTWKFYSSIGANAAMNSNLALGSYGPGAVDQYMQDLGSSNQALGHRRWIIFTQQQTMGTGDIPPSGSSPAANALYVLGNFNSYNPHQFISWPNAGYCPMPLLPARWSISYPHADFTRATVTMTQNGTNVPCSIIYADSDQANGMTYVGDNTLVWEPTLPTSYFDDMTFTVTVSGVFDDRNSGFFGDSITYTVTFFNPNLLYDSADITGPASPPSSGADYDFSPIEGAEAYQLQVTTGSTAAWTEGAEDSPTPQISTSTTGSYPVRQSALVRTGSKAFQLTFPHDVDGASQPEAYDFYAQSFQVTRSIIPSATSQLQFYQRGRYATTTTTLSAEVSTDDGNSWTSIWSRPGVGGTSAAWDSSFLATNVSLAAYAGKVIQVRFLMDGHFSNPSNSAYLGTGANYGFFIDDISISNATQLVSPTVTDLPGTASSFTFNAATGGGALKVGTGYYLRIRPEIGLRWYGYGNYTRVTPQLVTTPSSYSNWVSSHYPSVTGGPAGDFSGDGITNGYKYAFGLDPTKHHLPSALPAAGLSGSNLQLSYAAPSGIAGVTYGAQWSTDLVTWTDIPDTGSGNTHTFSVSTNGRPRLFLRHHLTFAP